MNDRVSVSEAAKRMGVSKTFVREGLARGLLPFGIGFKIDKSGCRRTFFISREAFEMYLKEGAKA